jgi:hypothetical protein
MKEIILVFFFLIFPKMKRELWSFYMVSIFRKKDLDK